MEYTDFILSPLTLSEIADKVVGENEELDHLLSEKMPYAAMKLAFVWGAMWQQARTKEDILLFINDKLS